MLIKSKQQFVRNASRRRLIAKTIKNTQFLVFFNYFFGLSAVVIGTGFLSPPKGQILDGVRTFLETRKTKFLQHGGLNVDYYSRTDVKLQEGIAI